MDRRVTIDTDRVVFKAHINDEGDIEVVLNTQDNVLIKVEANNRFTFKLEKPVYNTDQDEEQSKYYTTMTGVRKREGI